MNRNINNKMDEVSAKRYSEEILTRFGLKVQLDPKTKVHELWIDTEYIVFTAENTKEYIFVTSDYLNDKDADAVMEELKDQGYPNVYPLVFGKNKYCYRNDDFGIWCNFMVLEIQR